MHAAQGLLRFLTSSGPLQMVNPMMGVGFYVEQSLHEILGRFHDAVKHELKFEEPTLRLAAPILLRDIARAMKSRSPPPEPWRRGILLVLSQPEGGIKGLVREFSLLRRAVWDTLAARRHALPGGERRTLEGHLDEALAAAAERWADLVRLLDPVPLRIAPATSEPVAPGPAQIPRPPPLPARTADAPEPSPKKKPAT